MQPTVASRPRAFRPPLVYALVIGAVLATAVVVDLATYMTRHRDEVFPGVEAGGVELGGLSESESVEKLRAAAGVADGALTLRDSVDGREWRFAPADLGLRPAPETAARAAFEFGRSGRPIADFFRSQRARWRGVSVEADPTFDDGQARQTLSTLAPEVDVAPIDARIEVDSDGVQAFAAEPGRQLDLQATLDLLRAHAGSLDSGSIDIAMLITASRVFDLANVEAAYDLATSGPITLTWRRSSFSAEAEQVAAWFSIEDIATDDGGILPSIVVDREAIRAWLEPIAEQIRSDPVPARFDVDLTSVKLVSPASIGGMLDIEGSIERAIAVAYTDVRVGELAVQEIRPRAGTDALRSLQEVLPIAQAHIGFEGAPPGMFANITAAAGRLNGAALAPGQTFSFLQEMGDPLLLEGVEPAIIGLPADGIGHVSTAAFRAALLAGLPIDERHAPLTRVGWYEPPIGLDAAVTHGERDLRFTNDTGDWMLFKVLVDQQRIALSWTIYAKTQPRVVRFIGPTVSLVTPPPDGLAEIRETEGIPADAAVQAGWAREGALVVTERVVSATGGERRDRIVSEYAPAGDLILIGGAP